MARSLVLACCLTAAAARTTTWRDLEANPGYGFDDWAAEFGRSHGLIYTAKTEAAARAAFAENLATIRKHNAGESTYKMGVNQFTAMTREAFKKHMKGYAPNPAAAAAAPAPLEAHVAVEALPPAKDWRDDGVVTDPKDQGGCGSCWAFSATETVESHVAIATGKLLELAPQEFVDCAPNPDDCGGTGGCMGSTQWLAFNYTMDAGMALESDYPYKGSDGSCQMASLTPAAGITGYERLPANNYTALMNAVATIGPIAISAAAEPWQMYEEGIYDGDCGADVDHAIQLVGYGNETTGSFRKTTHDYWLVRNSWGSGWGEDGYIRIERFGRLGQEPCETDKTPQDGTECKGGPSEIQVCGLCGILSDSSYPTGAHA